MHLQIFVSTIYMSQMGTTLWRLKHNFLCF